MSGGSSFTDAEPLAPVPFVAVAPPSAPPLHDAATIKRSVHEQLGVELTDAEVQTVLDDTLRKLDPANYTYPLIHSLAFVLRPYWRIGFASQTHTASPLFAVGHGPGAEKLGGMMHNTELFGVLREALEKR